MREHYKDNIEDQERLSASIKLQTERLKRMDESLYDDKLSGDISQGKYEEKDEQFVNQTTELNEKLSQLDSSLSSRLEQKLVLIELSQKAAELYRKKSPEHKRVIISKLFEDLTLQGGIL